ncbi:MAG: phosphoglycerate kinase [Desulfurococcales archaeon]|nr:phosphoglycerate kinase [Desulfurococcales archaeon]
MVFKYDGKTIASLEDLPLHGKKVLARLDLNSPLGPRGEILDDTRFRMHLPTLKRLLESGSSIIIMTHQGRPLEGDFTRLDRHAEVLEKLLGSPVRYVPDVIGPDAKRGIRELGPGEVLLLDNTRLMSEDYIQAPPEAHAKTILVRELAELADYYVNDAFAVSHRSQATVVGFPLVLPSAGGILMEREVGALSKVLVEGDRPKVLVLGGAKISDAVKLVKSLTQAGSIDEVLTTGLVSLFFHMAMGTRLPGHVEEAILSRASGDLVVEARRLIASGAPVRVPIDYMVEYDDTVEIQPAKGLTGTPRDIGPSTIEYYRYKLSRARLIVLRGPAGVIEDPRFRRGTIELLRSSLESGAYTILGGGHFNAVLQSIPRSLVERIGHISSGGGAMIYFLTRKPLPGLESLALSYEKFRGVMNG